MRLPAVLMTFFKIDNQGNHVGLFHYITDLLIVCVYFIILHFRLTPDELAVPLWMIFLLL